jgi:hypothetical protein
MRLYLVAYQSHEAFGGGMSEELPRFSYGLPDIYDNAPWSETDIEDLKNHVAHGVSLEETAAFLCRGGTLFEVAAKAKELGLRWQTGGVPRKPKPPGDQMGRQDEQAASR